MTLPEARPMIEPPEKVYALGSPTTHLLLAEGPFGPTTTLCEMDPPWPFTWRGTGSPAEWARAEEQRLCARCERRWKAIVDAADGRQP